MNLFETVKASVSVLEAARAYGLTVTRHNMARCSFHDDRHPSLKLNPVCCSFLEAHPMKCVHGKLYTVDGLIFDEAALKREIFIEILSSILAYKDMVKGAVPLDVECEFTNQVLARPGCDILIPACSFHRGCSAPSGGGFHPGSNPG